MLFFRIAAMGFLILGGSAPGSAAPEPASSRTLRSMARSYLVIGAYDKAAAFAERAVQQAHTTPADEAAMCLIDRATVYSYSGQFEQAADFFEQGLVLQKRTLGLDHPSVAHTLRMLSHAYSRGQALNEAETVLREAVTIMLNHYGLEDKEMASFIFEAASLRFRQGLLKKAKVHYRSALELYNRYYGPGHLMTAAVQQGLAAVCVVMGDLRTAEILMNDAIGTQTRILGRDHDTLVGSWLLIARIYRLKGRIERSEYYLTKSKSAAMQRRDFIAIAEVFEAIQNIRNATPCHSRIDWIVFYGANGA